ncbi:MAG TPA: S8 family serine peptidase, partial [Gemmataceae bacterium]
YERGALIFNAAGNDGERDSVHQRFTQSVNVASTDANDVRSWFSNYGTGTDISAPGSGILSTVAGGGYAFFNGTSMASPNAAGAAALIWSLHPDWTRDQVAAQLLGTADNIDAKNPSYVGLLGSGRVNSYRALTETLAPPRLGVITGLPAEGGDTSDPIYAFHIALPDVFDSATVTAANFELRGAGADGKFDTADDVLVALSQGEYHVGSNELAFAVSGATPPGSYRFRALSGGLKDPFGQALDGDADGTAGGHLDRHFTIGAGAPPQLGAITGLPDEGGTTDQPTWEFTVATPDPFLPASVTIDRFELRSAGADDDFGTGDDVLVPIALAQPYTPGAASLRFLVNGVTPGGAYQFRAVSGGLTDPFGQPLDGNGDGTGGDDFVRSFTVAPPPAPRFGAITGLPDEGATTDQPIYSFSVAAPDRLYPATVTIERFELRGAGADRAFGTPDDVLVPLSFAAAYDRTAAEIRFNTSGVIPEGPYQFRAVSGGITDPFGQALDGNGDGTSGDDFVRSFVIDAASPQLGAVHWLPPEGGTSALPIDEFTVLVSDPLYPPSVTADLFDLREAGPDGQFDTPDDVLVPMTLNGGAAFGPSTTELRFVVNAPTPPGQYRF